MNEPDKLLAAALDDGSGAEFARHAAAHARRRRFARQLVLGGMTAAVASAWMLVAQRSGAPPSDRAPETGVARAPYEAMSDRELLEKLADHPVLLLREHGEISAVVFLPTKEKTGL
jgi:hypothetical protein